MADPKELQTNLTQYRAQLSQVDAALTTDPDNEELLKLKQDLEEVINLTLDLLKVNVKVPEAELPNAKWKVGHRCQAVWTQDGNYYPATIDLISDDLSTCTVTFDYGNTEIVKLDSLKDISAASAGDKRPSDNQESSSSKKISRKEKDQLREQKRKKMAKKQLRMKELEEQREGEKNRWLDFFNNSKNLKGVTKKSIFASPETLNGRVGVGTCGIGDKPMTSFKQDKVVYKK
ncbi:predicted protein [Nematostella vectensis]|uniref:Survival of motor neuron-related-splicing factor 30 n=1 Tax=Nematostella vectensis TaxID=45351 RepID=A7S946_NEMVE|nr:predicted protein [Nematostella vectensis]|eukprot:XP_001631833.1 predicted protein [Nematostella vectensis]